MNNKLADYPQKIIEFGFYTLAFLLPLIFTPATFEIFEFPKMTMVYFVTIIIASAYAAQVITTGKLTLRRTPLDKPIAVLLFVNVLSTFFSIDKYTSVFGYYTRFNGGLISLICYVALYYIFIGEVGVVKERREKFIKLLLLSAFFVSLYGILQHFGIDKDYWVQDVQRRVFSTLGQPNWLAAYLAMVLPIGLVFVIKNSKFQIPNILLTTTLYTAFWFTYSRSGLLGFGAAMITFLIFLGKENLKKHWRSLLLVGIAWVVVSIWTFSPTISEKIPVAATHTSPEGEAGRGAPQLQVPTGSTVKIRLAVWKGALNLIKDRPLLGTGPETFAYAFLPYRPVELNQTAEWEFLYNKAHNEFLHIAATTGVIGFAAYLWLITSFIFWNIKHRLASVLQAGLFAGWVGNLVSNFFGFSVVETSLLFWLYMALSVSLSKNGEKK